MPISESQLFAWTTPGALSGSATTHTSIKAALDAHSWPDRMSFETYLQGSYGNHTNIRGNSDVDLVVQAVGGSNGPGWGTARTLRRCWGQAPTSWVDSNGTANMGEGPAGHVPDPVQSLSRIEVAKQR